MAKGRKTGGRQKGAKNKRTRELEAATAVAMQGLSGEYTSLQVLQAIYRNPELSPSLRLAAAKEAAPYEHAKLSTVNVGAQAGSITFTFGRHGDPA